MTGWALSISIFDDCLDSNITIVFHYHFLTAQINLKFTVSNILDFTEKKS